MRPRIVVIEDEPLVALDIEAAVFEAGCEVAGNAAEISQALSLLEDAAHDCVILDANLAGESAKPVVDLLKNNNTPFIVVSGYARDQLGFLSADTLLIGKPFSFDELVVAIRDYVRRIGVRE